MTSNVLKNIIIPQSNSTATEWIIYFDKMRSQIGLNNAKINFLKNWQIRGNTSLQNDSQFVEYFKKFGMDFSSTIYDITASISEIGDSILGLPKNLMLLALTPAFLVIIAGISIPIYLIVKK